MPTLHHLPIAIESSQVCLEHEGEPEVLVQVGELARQTGKTIRALHLYEELGLLRPHTRSKGKFRLYGREALTRVRWIGKLQEIGLTLAEITELAREWGSTGSATVAMTRVRHVFEERLAQTRAHLAKLVSLETELVTSIDYLDVCDGCTPTRLPSHCGTCELHDCAGPAPDLVRGVQAAG